MAKSIFTNPELIPDNVRESFENLDKLYARDKDVAAAIAELRRMVAETLPNIDGLAAEVMAELIIAQTHATAEATQALVKGGVPASFGEAFNDAVLKFAEARQALVLERYRAISLQ